MRLIAPAFLIALACLTTLARAQSGRELIEEALQRYTLPAHVYEEYALVMTDRQGQYTVRTVRYYALRDSNGSRDLHIIESPAELKGTAIYFDRAAHEGTRQGVAASSPVFGTNFLVADLEGEQPHAFHYERESDQHLDRVAHFVLRVRPADASVIHATGYHERRIYLRKDNFFISRVDYQDGAGRQAKRLSYRDPRPDESGIWRAGMLLMEDLRDGRRTLLKVERRVHSPDYVPAAVFAGLQNRQ